MSKADIKLFDDGIQLEGEKIKAERLATGEAGAELERAAASGMIGAQGPGRYDFRAKRARVHDELRVMGVGNQDFIEGFPEDVPSVILDAKGRIKATKSVSTDALNLTSTYDVEKPGGTTEFPTTTEKVERKYTFQCESHGGARIVTTDDPAVLRLHSAPAHGFGASRLEFWSDPDRSDRKWRPGYITSHDHGGYTGCLKLFVNGHGKEKKEGALEVLSMSEDYVKVSAGAFLVDRREHASVHDKRRALSHGSEDTLVINCAGDYAGGVRVDGGLEIHAPPDDSVPHPGKPHYSLRLEHDAIVVTEKRGAAHGQPASTTTLDLIAEVRALRAEVVKLKEEVARLGAR